MAVGTRNTRPPRSNGCVRLALIAYGIGPKPASVRLCARLGAMKVCWTARDSALHDRLAAENDAVIFEGYRPLPVSRRADQSFE